MAPILGSVAQVLRQAETLKAALKSSVEDFIVGSEGWQSRQRLQDLYKSILLTDLESALDKKVEQDLWNSAFKSQVDFLRHQTKERKGPKKVEVQAVLTLFLEAASGFYIQLLQELCLTYRLDIPGHVRSSQLGILEEINGNSSPVKKPHTQSCYYICQDCLVHLGDIARYCDDPEQAEVFYHHALVLVPSNGQPYNQLAILASGKGDELATVYYYCRSIAVKNPFPAASTNLHKTLSKVVARHNTRDGIADISKAEFNHIFLQFHGLMYLAQDFDQARVLKDRVVAAFKGILKEDKFTSEFLTKLVTITVFVLWHIRTGGGDDLEDFDCIGKDEEECWQMTLEFTVELFDTLVLHVCENYPYKEQSAAECHVLPALNLLCQWMMGSSPNTWNGQLLKKTKVWEDFAALLNLFQVTHPHLPEKMDLPLHEDWELQSFLPLRVSQRKLTYSMKRTRPEDESVHRVGRLLRFGNRLVNNAPRVLSKLEDLTTGLSNFSLKINTSSPIEEEEKFPKSPQDIDLESAGQKLLASLPNLNKTTPAGTPFAETSSLFKGPLDVVQTSAGIVPPSPSTVAQYSLFQSGWNVPLTSAALSQPDHPSPRPVSKPSHHRVSPTDHLPSATGSNSVFPPTLPTPPVPENRRPTSFGTSFPPAAIQGNFNSPSQSPFGGFGYGGGWSSGVWAPNSSSASGSGGTSPGAHGLHSIWGSDFTPPSEGMSPLQQLLQEQKKHQQKDT
ncbi:protein SMG7-like [Stylophora pistillata]|uniref:Protein SMG7 n=1 Tax=Stylophora pistillata TaxID=50429 RepID=A0A2B4SRK4_STYPI|nr:protein SMG7-like [Stylophora pistillata]PFX33294.1 Protein SMG7 [Stylophora pistillata]